MSHTADLLLDQVRGWLPRQRWFASKGRTIARLSVAQSITLRTGEPSAELMVLTAEYEDGGPAEFYQLLVGHRAQLPAELAHMSIGEIDGRTAYDGVWDSELAAELLTSLAAGTERGWLRFIPEAGAQIPPALPSRVLGVEQSNTSIVFGEELVLKLFRRVAPGINPDLELHRALRTVGSKEVAELRASIEGTLGDQPTAFGLLQEFAGNSADGWSMALISVRDLLAEADLRADEVGGDFAGEAYRLGKTVAVMHGELASALGTGTMSSEVLSEGMRKRLDQALLVVPQLAELAGPLRTAFARVAEMGDQLTTQRVHGDLHLGQTLRTPRGWLLLDFEGEPARPLAERRNLEPPFRDVAGMLRSFDYAAYHQLYDWANWSPSAEGAPEGQLAWHAEEWSARNRESFCDGYAQCAGADPRKSRALLNALELDKAVYETVYETRNRPNWVQVPLRSLRRLLAA
ncbi:MAG TPA: aminoglycoside phosphotransferase [Pseudonocardia sp.]